VLAFLFVWGASLITIAGRFGLFDRRVLHRDLPVLLLRHPDRFGPHGYARADEMGPWDLGGPLFRLVAVASILSALFIFFIGVRRPNGWALWITVGFVILAAIIWVAFEQRRFQGPPIGDMIAKRQAENRRRRKGDRRA